MADLARLVRRLRQVDAAMHAVHRSSPEHAVLALEFDRIWRAVYNADDRHDEDDHPAPRRVTRADP